MVTQSKQWQVMPLATKSINDSQYESYQGQSHPVIYMPIKQTTR
jgi:hypothetical protein